MMIWQKYTISDFGILLPMKVHRSPLWFSITLIVFFTRDSNVVSVLMYFGLDNCADLCHRLERNSMSNGYRIYRYKKQVRIGHRGRGLIPSVHSRYRLHNNYILQRERHLAPATGVRLFTQTFTTHRSRYMIERERFVLLFENMYSKINNTQ